MITGGWKIADSPETRAFIDEENAYTQRYMEQARIRPQINDDMDALEHVSSWSVPIERGNDLFFEKMLAGEEQPRFMFATAGPIRTSGSSIQRSSAAIPTLQ